MIGWALLIAGGVVLTFALLSPLESLRWWVRRRDAPLLAELTRAESPSEPDAVQPRQYVVYLSGIGTVDGTIASRRERAVLDDLARLLPDTRVISDVFPYAVDNRGLTQRSTTWFWRRLARLRRIPIAKLASYLINLRNALRVLVSADPRYGPTLNVALAREIAESLTRHGYSWAQPAPVTVIGYSGGGQMSLGAGGYLAGIGVPVSVISIGGVLSDDPALDRVQHVWHFWGSRDLTHNVADVIFPGRWPTARLSAWNKAKSEGRVTERQIGPMRHQGGRDYFDRHHRDESGSSYRELTTAALVDALT